MSTTHDRLVVGVDGSADSKRALRWAIAQARRTGDQVVAVTAWEVPVRILVLPTATEQDYADHAASILRETLDDVVGDAGDVTVHPQVLEGRPERVLTRVAGSADTLVVGSHGRGELPGMHLGSTAAYCVHHAPCPVVVLREAAA